MAAAGWIFSKETVQGMPPFGFIGLRFILAAVLLFLFCYRGVLAASRPDLLRAAGTGLVLGLSLTCWIHAIAISGTLGEGAFIMSLSMLVVPLLAWPLFKEKPAGIFWLSLPIALVGLFFLSSTEGKQWGLALNQLWFLAAAILLALHFNLNSQCSRRLPALVLTSVQLLVTGFLGIAASLLFETWPNTIDNAIWGWFLLSTVLATSLRYLMQTAGQQNSSSSNAALIMLLEPVWTVVLSVAIYREQLSTNKVIGSTLILLALVAYRSTALWRKYSAPQSAG
ncbi:DMT family transporter [Salinimonas sediminis]|uniref:DMT family transporter n=1 Tax=Salinimonas sediminis TaxID=2303538 RepID=UPI001E48A343|nr:DMT family transporter [Salinimonas sediminis]